MVRPMKVLFVSSKNSGKISPIVSAQGDSLKRLGLEVEFFGVVGKGVLGYLKSCLKLRRHLRRNNFDVVHAHYSLCGYIAYLAGARPLVVSLMGSDAKSSNFLSGTVKFFAKKLWNATIVKSNEMKESLGVSNLAVIPNGVDLIKFDRSDKSTAQDKLGWDKTIKHVLFAANPARPVKNFLLFKRALDSINSIKVEYHVLNKVSHEQVVDYMNASDIICLSSKREGSPNVIKEAMACEIPIVSTNVGDVNWLFNETPGHFICEHNSVAFAKMLDEAFVFSQSHVRTTARQRLKTLGLDSYSVSKKIQKIYTNQNENIN
jgi:teichuronic acid biosynthesis glycosyltransferase TuaC